MGILVMGFCDGHTVDSTSLCLWDREGIPKRSRVCKVSTGAEGVGFDMDRGRSEPVALGTTKGVLWLRPGQLGAKRRASLGFLL